MNKIITDIKTTTLVIIYVTLITIPTFTMASLYSIFIYALAIIHGCIMVCAGYKFESSMDEFLVDALPDWIKKMNLF